MAHRIQVARDGAEALDYLFSRGVNFHQFCEAVRELGFYRLLLNQTPRTAG